MKGDNSRTCVIRLSFLNRHFFIGTGEIPINCVHFRLSILTYSAIPLIYCHKHMCLTSKIGVIPATSDDVVITGLKLEWWSFHHISISCFA